MTAAAAAVERVPVMAPISRFDPSMVAWCGHTTSNKGDTRWTVEVLHLNHGRKLLVADISGNAQMAWRTHFLQRRDGGAAARKDGTAPAAEAAASAFASVLPTSNETVQGATAEGDEKREKQRVHGGPTRGIHMQRTCRKLVERGLATWDGGAGGGGPGKDPWFANVGAGDHVKVMVRVNLPGGATLKSVRWTDGKRKKRAKRCGKPPTILLPHLTAAGRMVWMQYRLGIPPLASIGLALLWGRQKSSGFFVKSTSLLSDNIWTTPVQIRRDIYGQLSHHGYLKPRRHTGKFMKLERMDAIEPYGPMLDVIEEMVYAARAGEHVYDDVYDDAINRAYMETVANLGEHAGGNIVEIVDDGKVPQGGAQTEGGNDGEAAASAKAVAAAAGGSGDGGGDDDGGGEPAR